MAAKSKKESKGMKALRLEEEEANQGIIKELRRAYAAECAAWHITPCKQVMTFLKNATDLGELFHNLVVSDFDIGPVGTSALMDTMTEQYTKIKHVNFWRTNSQDLGCKAMARFTHASTWIISLELIDVKLGVEGCVALGEALQVNESLKTLVLDHNPIGDEGVIALGKGVKWNTTMKHVSLKYCSIEAEGAASLAHNFLDFVPIIDLDLMGNRIGALGMAAIGTKLANNKSLTTLVLYDNNLTEEPQHAYEAMRDGLARNSTLTSLDLDGNLIGDDGAGAILEAFKSRPNLVTLKVTTRLSRDLVEEFLSTRRLHMSMRPKKKKKRTKKK